MSHYEIEKEAIEAFKVKNRERAVSLVKELIQQNALLGDNWLNIAKITTSYGETNLSRQAVKNFIHHNPDDISRNFTAANVMAEMGQLDEALAYLKPLLNKFKKDPRINHFYGTILALQGEKQQAMQHLRITLKKWETSGQTWLLLGNLKKFTADDKDLLRMQSLMGKVKTSDPANQAAFMYALGKALCDVGDLDAAFVYYDRAAKLASRSAPSNLEREQEFADKLIKDYSKKALNDIKSGNSKSQRPIFIMGTPRSGTTLVEQILASHSQVADGAELNLFLTAALDMSGFTLEHANKHCQASGNDGSAWNKIADTYLHLLEERFGPEPETGGRIVDKTLNNSRLLGLIHKCLPQAPIIWMRRNPSDSALSCYRTFFNKSLQWSWNFKDIAQFFNMEDAIYNHWMKIYPELILTVPYEELVDKPELWMEKILNHCGLEVEEQVYSFHKTKRTVYTSSVEQVRNPINKNAVGIAEKYSEYMQDFSNNYAK